MVRQKKDTGPNGSKRYLFCDKVIILSIQVNLENYTMRKYLPNIVMIVQQRMTRWAVHVARLGV
jgi:hypothetical protein